MIQEQGEDGALSLWWFCSDGLCHGEFSIKRRVHFIDLEAGSLERGCLSEGLLAMSQSSRCTFKFCVLGFTEGILLDWWLFFLGGGSYCLEFSYCLYFVMRSGQWTSLVSSMSDMNRTSWGRPRMCEPGWF